MESLYLFFKYIITKVLIKSSIVQAWVILPKNTLAILLENTQLLYRYVKSFLR
jgi:hypothetical protein